VNTKKQIWRESFVEFRSCLFSNSRWRHTA
jgi:hypothetical protein